MDTIYRAHNPLTKFCPKCQQILPQEAFYANKAQLDGLAPYCRECWNAVRRATRAKKRAGIPDKRYRLFQHVRHDYFSNVETPMQAYLLGILASDGNVASARCRIKLSLDEQDRELLELFRNELAPAHPISPDHHHMMRVAFTSPQMYADLASFGIVPQKSLILQWPDKLPVQLVNSFLLGVYDGDGYITADKRKVNPYFIVGFTSGSHLFLEQVAQTINSTTGVSQVHVTRNPTCFVLRYGGNSAKVVHDWLHAELPGLTRKRIPENLLWIPSEPKGLPCSCGKPIVALGLCQSCYDRQRYQRHKAAPAQSSAR